MHVSPPYVLVGQSGGGKLAIGCARRYPECVAGLVTIDGHHDDPDVLRAERFIRSDLRRPIGDFPVFVISATRADAGGEPETWPADLITALSTPKQRGTNLSQLGPAAVSP